jgi:hypothetical protein
MNRLQMLLEVSSQSDAEDLISHLDIDDDLLLAKSNFMCCDNKRAEQIHDEAKATEDSGKSLLLLLWKRHKFQGSQTITRSTNNNILQNMTSIQSMMPFVTLINSPLYNQQNVKSQYRFKHSTVTITAIIFDAILGFFIGYACLTHQTVIVETLACIYEQHQRLWKLGLIYLQSNPGGVKMNQALTTKIAMGVQWTLHRHHEILLHASACASPILQCVGVGTIVFGARFFLALSFDCTRLAFGHVTLLSHFFATCLHYQLLTLSSLWLLFCGKKRNILRFRSDHLHYDHMQLLLGMLLFSVCLFMFTTVLVHHCFFVGVGLVYELMLCGIWLGYMGIESWFCLDKVLREGQRAPHVTLLPVSWEGVNDKIDNVYVTRYFNGISQFERNAVEACSDSRQISPCVSVSSAQVVLSRLVFPVTSNSSIISNALIKFFASSLVRMTSFLPRMLFASPCRVVSSCIDITYKLHWNVCEQYQ